MESVTGTASSTVRDVCRDGKVGETVVSAVAEAKGVDPLELDPLYAAVDPDALNSLFCPAVGSPPPSMELSFSVEGCRVVVHGDGEVVVTPPTATEGGPRSVVPRED